MNLRKVLNSTKKSEWYVWFSEIPDIVTVGWKKCNVYKRITLEVLLQKIKPEPQGFLNQTYIINIHFCTEEQNKPLVDDLSIQTMCFSKLCNLKLPCSPVENKMK